MPEARDNTPTPQFTKQDYRRFQELVALINSGTRALTRDEGARIDRILALAVFTIEDNNMLQRLSGLKLNDKRPFTKEEQYELDRLVMLEEIAHFRRKRDEIRRPPQSTTIDQSAATASAVQRVIDNH
jgi:hypothetical protein